MKHIFYFIGLLFLLYEIIWILYPEGMYKRYNKRKEFFKDAEKRGASELSDTDKFNIVKYFVVSFGTLLWLLGGLLTFNWMAFLMYWLIQIIIIAPLSALFKYFSLKIIVVWVNAVISAAFSVFVIVNSYHLHIKIEDYIFNYLKI